MLDMAELNMVVLPGHKGGGKISRRFQMTSKGPEY